MTTLVPCPAFGPGEPNGLHPVGPALVEDDDNAEVAVVILGDSDAQKSVVHSASRDKVGLLRQAYFGGAPVPSAEPWSYETEEADAKAISDQRR